MKTEIPNVTTLREQIAQAKDRSLEPIRTEAEKILAGFAEHLNKLLTNPNQFTSHTCFVAKLPVEGEGTAKMEYFFRIIREKLVPLGYLVEKSHDGGGMYGTVVIRWDIISTHRRWPHA